MRQSCAVAAEAEGDWLLFLHADTRLGQGWRDAADDHAAHFGDQAGCFRFRLDSRAWQARIVEQGVAARVRLFGLAYGDQGLLISRALYKEIGGYRPFPLMEDVDLVQRLGARRLRCMPAEAVTSATRWEMDGWLRRSAGNLGLLALYKCGLSPAKIAERYR